MTTEGTMHESFKHDQYLIRKKVFKIFGGAFHVYDSDENLLFYSQQKAFKLKEDFRVYSDEQQTEELLTIKTPQILDLGATYNVTCGVSGEALGAVRRKGLKSIFKDEWMLLSTDGREIGRITESSLFAALVSRLVNLIPQSYIVETAMGERIADIKQHFNPFILKYTMTIVGDSSEIDRRLVVAAGILLAGIEGRQQ